MKRAAAFLGFSLLLLFPAFWNGFPLVYSDTGTYIASGFQGFVPQDRPLPYGFFLRHTSLSESLWLTIISQALLAAALIYVFAQLFLAETLKPRSFLLVGILLCFFSTLPWYASFLMADAFTGLSFLLLLFLFFGLNQKPWRWAVLLGLYWFFTATHLTHANAHLVVWGTMILLSIFKGIRQLVPIKRMLWVGAAILLNYLFLPSFHYWVGKEFTYPKKSYYYVSSRLVENGTMKTLLDQQCATHHWQMCQYKDSLPTSGSDFLWTEKSPIYKLNAWGKELTELKEINGAVLSEPALLKENILYLGKISIKQTQLTAVAEEYLPYDTLTPPGWEVANHFRSELTPYLNSKQQQNKALAASPLLSPWMHYTLLVSIAVLILSLIIGFGSNRQKLMIFLILLGYLANVIAVSIASEGSRYNSRYYWLIVLCAILILFKYFQEKWRFKES